MDTRSQPRFWTATRLLSGVGDTHWIAPAAIRFKIGPSKDLHGVLGGDWDIKRRHEFAETAKYRAIVQRFVDGREWLETDLFTDAYSRRLKRDGRVGRCGSLAELAKDYERRFGVLFEEMRRDGFRLTSHKGKPHPLPSLLIGRDGDVFIGNQGNHRLAIAKVVGLGEIAGRVVCRHRLTL